MSQRKVKTDRDPSRLALLWAQNAAGCFSTLSEMDPDKPASQDAIRGFFDGIRRRAVPYPGENPGGLIPPIRPEFGRDYERGYGTGEQFADAVDVFTNPEVAEKWLKPETSDKPDKATGGSTRQSGPRKRGRAYDPSTDL